jgi:hypothetical protein
VPPQPSKPEPPGQAVAASQHRLTLAHWAEPHVHVERRALAACDCGWNSGTVETVGEAADAYRDHRQGDE